MTVKYLQQGYKNTFYFRIAVPLDLRHILKLTHIRRSLHADSGGIRPPIPLQSGPPVPERSGPGIPL